MSQRNPMNDRYKEQPAGKTRKSAASAKPVSKAAASVYIESGKAKPAKKSLWKRINGIDEAPKTAKQQKAEDAAKAKKKAENDRRKEMRHFKPKSSEYRMYNMLRICFFCVGFLFVLPNALWPNYFAENQILGGTLLILAWGCVLAAIITDIKKIKPIREAEYLKAQKHKGKN